VWLPGVVPKAAMRGCGPQAGGGSTGDEARSRARVSPCLMRFGPCANRAAAMVGQGRQRAVSWCGAEGCHARVRAAGGGRQYR